VLLNIVFGIALAWLVIRFEFLGKMLFVMLVDLFFVVFLVIVGMFFVLFFGGRGLFGSWFFDHGLRVLFFFVGVVLVMVFVMLFYVVRELVSLLVAQGHDEELVAFMFGAR